MSPHDFKAWFSGFISELSGPPTETQWNKVKLAVERMQGRGLPAWVENPEPPDFVALGKEQAKVA
jgi:hypothetical protein